MSLCWHGGTAATALGYKGIGNCVEKRRVTHIMLVDTPVQVFWSSSKEKSAWVYRSLAIVFVLWWELYKHTCSFYFCLPQFPYSRVTRWRWISWDVITCFTILWLGLWGFMWSIICFMMSSIWWEFENWLFGAHVLSSLLNLEWL